MANNKKIQIKKLKNKVVEKLDELLENENAQVVLKSCATILELNDGDDDAVVRSDIKTLAELINNPKPDREIGHE